MTQISPQELAYFVVYSPVIGKHDPDEEKILYFYPPDTHINEQLNFCGFFDALINFSTSFSNNFGGKCESVHLEKHRYLFFEPEQNYIFVLIVKNPTVTLQILDEKVDASLPNDLPDFLLRGLLKQLYMSFKLTHGEVSRFSRNDIREFMKPFFSYHLETIDFLRLNTIDTLSGMDVSVINTPAALTAQTILSQIEASNPFISRAVIFNNSSLVFSELNMDDTHNLWMTLFGKAIKQHLPAKNQRYFTESLSILQPYLTAPAHVGFLPPIPDNTSSSQYFLKLPVVFLEDGMLRYRMLLFKHNALSFLLLIEDPPTTSPPLKPTTVRPSALSPHFAQFSFSQMEKDISNLAFSTARFFEQGIENPFEEEKLKGVRYLFINHIDLLLHNTITTQSQPSDTFLVDQFSSHESRAILHTVASIHNDLNSSDPEPREIAASLTSGHWVIGRKLCEREVICVFDSDVTSLSQASERLTSCFNGLRKAFI